jgi:hypothetical protein
VTRTIYRLCSGGVQAIVARVISSEPGTASSVVRKGDSPFVGRMNDRSPELPTNRYAVPQCTTALSTNNLGATYAAAVRPSHHLRAAIAARGPRCSATGSALSSRKWALLAR